MRTCIHGSWHSYGATERGSSQTDVDQSFWNERPSNGDSQQVDIRPYGDGLVTFASSPEPLEAGLSQSILRHGTHLGTKWPIYEEYNEWERANLMCSLTSFSQSSLGLRSPFEFQDCLASALHIPDINPIKSSTSVSSNTYTRRLSVTTQDPRR